jgi:predicted RNase H-like HicB family nuclease
MTKETKPIDYYLEADYPVTVYNAPEGGYVAEVEDLPGCLTEGETLQEAFQRIEEARRAWIEVAYEDGTEIPLPRTDRKYSGRFVVRIARSLHRRLAEQAEWEGISLNQNVENILSASVALESLKKHLHGAIRQRLQDTYSHRYPNYLAVAPDDVLWVSPLSLSREERKSEQAKEKVAV